MNNEKLYKKMIGNYTDITNKITRHKSKYSRKRSTSKPTVQPVNLPVQFNANYMTEIDNLDSEDEPLSIEGIRRKNIAGGKLTDAEYKTLMKYFDVQRKLDLQQNQADLRDRNELNKQAYRFISNNLDKGIKGFFS